jgi:hypothetical protein
LNFAQALPNEFVFNLTQATRKIAFMAEVVEGRLFQFIVFVVLQQFSSHLPKKITFSESIFHFFVIKSSANHEAEENRISLL